VLSRMAQAASRLSSSMSESDRGAMELHVRLLGISAIGGWRRAVGQLLRGGMQQNDGALVGRETDG